MKMWKVYWQMDGRTTDNRRSEMLSWGVFFLGITPLFNFEICQKLKIVLKQFVNTTPLKPLNRFPWNFVAMKDMQYKFAYSIEFMILSPFSIEINILKRFVTATPLKPLSRISCNLIVKVDIMWTVMCTFTGFFNFLLREQLEILPNCHILCSLCESHLAWIAETLAFPSSTCIPFWQ